MGEVWTAEHLALKRMVAMKVIRARHLDDETTIARFLREARATAQLRNRHVVQVLDHGNAEGVVFIVMELMRGMTVRDALLLGDQRLSYADIRRLFRHVEAGVDVAHQRGIVHRDLKPSNLFLNFDDTSWHVKVMDFGLAKPTETDPNDSIELKTRQGIIVGTPAYMSPERLRNGDTSIQSDLWSLAIMAFELVCGKRPFEAENRLGILVKIATEVPPTPSRVQPDIPDGFDEWFARACHPDQESRFANVRELIQALDSILQRADDHDDEYTLQTRLEEESLAGSISTMQFSSELVGSSHDSTRLDMPSLAETVADSSQLHSPVQSTGASRAQLTPIEVAELQTQIQYRLMEQLREAKERNQELVKALNEKDSDSDSEE